MDSAEYQKKKKRKEAFKKFVINFFIWLLIIAFVSTLGVYWGKDVNVNVIKIAKIGKKSFNYHPGSIFNYILIFNREKLANFLPRNIDQDTFNNFLINYSVENLLNNGHLYVFGKELGLSPSRDILRNIIEYNIKGALTGSPSKGLVDYAYMEYVNHALASENGDIMNALGVVTMSELFSYYDLFSYYAEAEIVIFDYTNYVAKKITDDELEAYFNKNFSNYVSEIKIDDIAASTKELASEVHKYAKENGFDKAVEQYKSKAKVSTISLTRKTGMAKRFELALKLKEGEVAQKVQFENGEYHVIRLKEITKFSSLKPEVKKDLLVSYLMDNKETLLKKYKEEIDKVLSEANNLIVNGKSLKDISTYLSANFYKANRIVPVSRYIYSEDKKIIPISLEENPEVIDSVFTSELNKIKVINKDKYAIFLKAISRKTDKNFSYTNINQEVMKEYMQYKASAISRDWMNSLEKRYKATVYTNEIEKLKKGNLQD
ncbi:MAG: peptidyl-prolyl cis-trans isomerase [Brevinematia bacterium]